MDTGSEPGGKITGGTKFESRYDRKGGKSVVNLNKSNKVSIGENHREYVNFLDDINPGSTSKIGRGSMNSSHMMIEISDVEVQNPLSRA